VPAAFSIFAPSACVVQGSDEKRGADSSPDSGFGKRNVNSAHFSPQKAHKKAEGAQQHDGAQQVPYRERRNSDDYGENKQHKV
jgi:hypothetical protein